MAKKQVQVIELDIITKGLDTAEASFSKMTENTGDLGKKSKEILKDISKAKAIMNEYGDEMPIGKAKELQKLLEKIGNNADDVSQMETIKIFGDKELDKIKKINSQLDEYNKKIEQQNKLQEEALAKRNERVEQLKNQKTANLTQGDGSKKTVKLDSIKGQWNSKEDLEKIASNKGSSAEQVEAAKAVLEQLTKAEDQYTKVLEEAQSKIKKYEGALADLRAAKAELNTTTRELTDAEKLAGESTAMFAQTQASQLNKVVEANQKLGNSAIDTSNKLKKQQASLGGVVKSLFSWTAAWNLGKKLYKEAVRTIKEMDQALTGMAMVTGQSRDEVDKLIPRIQSLAKETSTAMTEIAGLITEYTKQGRTLEESFILAEETAKAAKIAGISASESIKYMTSAINGFNLAAKDAVRVSDIFANLAAVSATDYEQLAISLSKVSAQANTAGMSIEFTTALLAKGIETTQEAPESIGTALKTILARMRELSDYGKILEDGGSVNKVENALAAAGIELRDVNGQFRDLEQIFNELGPKWDSLNTMQQQAIAQAVAGTRQQSRFVAIMQDWQRTQELATEAQDSAGASAAQYAVYAEGMEAAMTNMKTAWQEFTQSLTSSKIIIGLVNGITKVLDNITSFLESGGKSTKVIFMAITAIVAMNNILTPLKKALGMETDREKILELQKLELLKKQAEVNERLLKQEHEKRKAAALDIKEKLEKAEKEQELAQKNIKDYKQSISDRESSINTHNANYGDDGQYIDPESDPQLISLRAQLAEEEKILKTVEEQITKKKGELNAANESVRQSAEQIENAEKNTEEATKAYNAALEQCNHPIVQRINMVIKELEVEREGVRLAKLKAKSQKELNALKKKEADLTKRITTLEKKKQKVVSTTQGLFSRIGYTISTSIESGLRSVLSSLGPIGDLLSSILTSVINWGVELIGNLGINKLVTKEKQTQVAEEEKETVVKTAQNAQDAKELTLDTADTVVEKEETDTEQEQLVTQGVQSGLDTTENVQDATNLVLEKQETKEEKKQSGTKLTNALFGMAQSASQMGPVGWIIAAAILAAAGVAIGVSAASASSVSGTANAATDKQAESSIAKRQNTSYQLKKSNSELSSKIVEIDNLDSKQYLSAEDKKQRDELIESLRNSNEAWKNFSDDRVLEEAKKSVQRNTDQIKNNIESNYEVALQMENLTGELAKQAIVDKMKKDQKNINVGPKGDLELAKQYANSMAEVYVDQNAEVLSDSLKSSEYSVWDGIVDGVGTATEFFGVGLAGNLFNGINTWATGGGFWAGVDDILLDGAWGEISDIVNDSSLKWYEKIGHTLESAYDAINDYIPSIGTNIAGGLANATDMGFKIAEGIKAENEQEAAKKAIELANKEIMDFAGQMSEAGTDVYDQLLKYGDIIGDYSEITKAVAAQQFSTIDLLYQITNKSESTAKNLKLLSDAGLLTSNSLLAMTDGLVNTTTQATQAISNGLSIYSEGISSGNEHASIESLTTDLGLELGASIEEITEAYLKKYAKYNDDGSLKIDESTGLLAMKDGGSGAIYDALLQMSGSMGDYASYTKKQLEVLQSLQGEVDVNTLAQEFIDNTTKLLNLKTEDDVKDFNNDVEKQKEAAKIIYAEGMKMIDQSLASQKGFIDEKQSELEKLRKEYGETTDETKKAEIQEAISNINEILGPVTNRYQQSLAKLTDATLQAAGYISAATIDEKMKSYESTQERLAGLLSKLSDKSYSSEDLKYIREDLAPIFESMFRDRGEEFDLDKFYNSFVNQTDYAYIALNDLFKYTGKELNNEILTSISAAEAHIAELKLNPDNYDENGELTDEARANLDQWENELSTAKMELSLIDDLIKNEVKLYDIRKSNYETRMDYLKKEENGILHNYDVIQRENRAWERTVAQEYDQEMGRLAQNTLKSLNLSKEQLNTYLKFTNGKIDIDEEWYDSLEETHKKLLNDNLDMLKTYAEDWQTALDTIAEDVQSFYSYQIDQQNELLDIYKSKLEEEQESLQNSLDKRKEMYEKYFDSLDNESEDENFEEEQARLQKAISSLSSATDATSLEKLKGYQQALSELEEEHLQTERDRRRDATMETLDNQSEYFDQYYEDRLENEQALWTEITKMTSEEITDLMENYNEEYKNATDLNKAYMLLSYKQLHADVMTMMGNTDGAARATADYENYKRWMEKYADDPTIGSYDSKKAYSQGGLVDYTGLAMVHGSTRKPEAFLNASQTAIFSSLAQNLEAFYIKPSLSAQENNKGNEQAITIENFTIAVDATLTDNNVQQTGESLAEALLNGLRRTGVSVNMKK